MINVRASSFLFCCRFQTHKANELPASFLCFICAGHFPGKNSWRLLQYSLCAPRDGSNVLVCTLTHILAYLL